MNQLLLEPLYVCSPLADYLMSLSGLALGVIGGKGCVYVSTQAIILGPIKRWNHVRMAWINQAPEFVLTDCL